MQIPTLKMFGLPVGSSLGRLILLIMSQGGPDQGWTLGSDKAFEYRGMDFSQIFATSSSDKILVISVSTHVARAA